MEMACGNYWVDPSVMVRSAWQQGNHKDNANNWMSANNLHKYLLYTRVTAQSNQTYPLNTLQDKT